MYKTMVPGRSLGMIFLMSLLQNGFIQGVQSKKCEVKYDLSMCYSSNTSVVTDNSHECLQDFNICRPWYNITYIKIAPYNSLIARHLLGTCCGSCSTLRTVTTLRDLSHVTPAVMNTSHFIFPVLGRSDSNMMYGQYFIPFIEPPILYYITIKDVSMFLHLLSSCLKMWPIVVTCLLLAAVSGFICWLIETWQNKEEFPRSFLQGWFEGFWWSLITMTTVGYGDKVPRTVCARLFSAFWIIVGIATFSVVTGLLSSEIIEALYPLPPSLAKSKVGALRHRTYDASVIARQGGIMIDVEPEGDDDNSAVFHLVSKLRTKEIDGIILDRHAFIAFATHITPVDGNQTGMPSKELDFFNMNTIHTEIKYTGENLAFGILFKHKHDYNFFHDFISDHVAVLNACHGLIINNFTYGLGKHEREMHEYSLFLVFARFFWPVSVAFVVAFLMICCFGILYEMHRGTHKMPRWRSFSRFYNRTFRRKESAQDSLV